MREFLDRALRAGGARPFLRYRERTWTYAAAGDVVARLAEELHREGLAEGDRLAIHLPTSPEHLFLWLATVKAGIVSCPIHPDAAPAEVEASIELLSPRGVFDRTGLRLLDASAAPCDPSIVTILTTSGTTGRPKAAMLSGRMAVLTGEGFAQWLRLTREDRLFTCLPLSHVNARFYSTLGALAAGASLALEERFSASRFWASVRASGATEVNAIGAMLKILLDRPPEASDRDHGLRLVYAAPALGREAHLAFEERFGVRLVIGYGLTESTFGFIQPLDERRDLDAMGVPRGHGEVRLVDGEVQLRNDASFSGYFGDDAATRAAWTDDGWLKTGDLARVTADGHYVFLGRKKLVIRRRGENLTPGEVEEVLERHPSVLEAGVIGVPSPLGEDDVLACVVLRAGASVTADELAAHAAKELAAFKVPTRWRFLDALPRTPTQRIAYDELRAAVTGDGG
ncbi:MAG TPA: AMP-binding protein [Candidatus Bathyarchaeia archaeon]|nr:AMP-binding protein [Candidatus Bathyarchaeia archaeon]